MNNPPPPIWFQWLPIIFIVTICIFLYRRRMDYKRKNFMLGANPEEIKKPVPVYAGFWIRFQAGFIDTLLLYPIGAILMLVSFQSKGLSLSLALPIALLFSCYEVYFHAKYGATIGKKIVRIKVLSVDWSKLTWQQSILRNSIGLGFSLMKVLGTFLVINQVSSDQFDEMKTVELIRLFKSLKPAFVTFLDNLGMAWSVAELVTLLFNDKKRSLHDLMAGTVVVHRIPLASGRAA